MLICDSQVHAPPVPGHTGVNGIEGAPLLDEMARADVDRAIVVPITNTAADDENSQSIDLAHRHPDRFRVMGLVRVAGASPLDDERLRALQDRPEVLGIRISCYREPNRSLLERDHLDWLWAAAERLNIAVMILASGNLDKVARLADRHPELRVVVDHLGLDPFAVFTDEASFLNALEPLLPLARRSNIAVKASGLPNAVDESWPFPTTHQPVRRVLDAFGPTRTFWGSDLTRLTCTYRECVAHFTDGLPFLEGAALELVMGRAICDWLHWA
jgi:predicted TIM-barrel fold metal-dependent hydrolase